MMLSSNVITRVFPPTFTTAKRSFISIRSGSSSIPVTTRLSGGLAVGFSLRARARAKITSAESVMLFGLVRMGSARTIPSAGHVQSLGDHGGQDRRSNSSLRLPAENHPRQHQLRQDF